MTAITYRDAESGAGWQTIDWREQIDSAEWDRLLARVGGHPLQSALWGDARREIDGIKDRRAIARGSFGTLMVRLELRRVPFVGAHVGWVPRGPSGDTVAFDRTALGSFLRTVGVRPSLVVTDLWTERSDGFAGDDSRAGPLTIWLDLTGGRDAVLRQFKSPFRQGIRKSREAGVTVEQTRSVADQEKFLALTNQLGELKGFNLSLSRGVLEHLLGSPVGDVSAHLFVARCGAAFGATALILKCGRSIHYIAGGTDREYSRQRVGEALHWAIIEWAVGQGASLYDLEGIDRKRNPGTFAFKKKMGGREVALAGKSYYSLSRVGIAIAALDRWRDRLTLSAKHAA